MFGLFKKKSKTELLTIKYKKLLKQAHELSTMNRSQSDSKYVEADILQKEIDKLQNL